MRDEEMATDNLRSFSQNTHYIFDWCHKASSPHTQKHQNASSNRIFLPLKEPNPRPIREEHPKHNALCQFEYPIIQEAEIRTRKGSKRVMKCQGMLKLAQLQKEKQKRSKLIDRLVEDEFERITQQIFNQLSSNTTKKKSRAPPGKLRSNSLPYLSHKPSLDIQQHFSKPSAAIIIDNYDPPGCQTSRHRSTCRLLGRPCK